MTDWSGALRFAYEQHVSSRSRRDGFGGFGGFGDLTPNEIKDLPAAKPETTSTVRVVSVVSPGRSETSETTGTHDVVSPAVGPYSKLNQELAASETIETTETTGAKASTESCGRSGVKGWVSAFSELDPDRPLDGFGHHRWHQMLHDGERFLDHWGVAAVSLGWTAEDLFGVHPVAPAARYDCMGLVPLIGGGEIIDVRTDRATIRMPSGNCLVYYLRRPNPDAVLIWDPIVRR